MSGATVDLGNIKFNWKGPWANSTAYVVNDTVFSSPHGYVCITAHTSHASDANLATSDSAYWNQMTAGSTTGLPDQTGQAGEYLKTDGATATWEAIVSDPTMGGDLTGTASNAQIAADAVTTTEIIDNAVTGAKIAMGSDAIGDLLYYNGTDYVRLAAGTSAQILTSAGAAAPAWSAAAAGGGKVLQVLQAVKTDTQTTTTNAWVDVTGLSIAITPAATTSKILVSAMVLCVGTVGAAGAWVNIVRDSTEIAIATGVGSRWAASSMGYAPDAGDTRPMSTIWLDSPATTSATTYKVQFTANGANTAYINRTAADGNTAGYARGVSTITVMEIGV